MDVDETEIDVDEMGAGSSCIGCTGGDAGECSRCTARWNAVALREEQLAAAREMRRPTEAALDAQKRRQELLEEASELRKHNFRVFAGFFGRVEGGFCKYFRRRHEWANTNENVPAFVVKDSQLGALAGRGCYAGQGIAQDEHVATLPRIGFCDDDGSDKPFVFYSKARPHFGNLYETPERYKCKVRMKTILLRSLRTTLWHPIGYANDARDGGSANVGHWDNDGKLYALQDIEQGEELFFDYGDEFFKGSAKLLSSRALFSEKARRLRAIAAAVERAKNFSPAELAERV